MGQCLHALKLVLSTASITSKFWNITDPNKTLVIQSVSNPKPAVGKVNKVSTDFKYGPPFGQRTMSVIAVGRDRMVFASLLVHTQRGYGVHPSTRQDVFGVLRHDSGIRDGPSTNRRHLGHASAEKAKPGPSPGRNRRRLHRLLRSERVAWSKRLSNHRGTSLARLNKETRDFGSPNVQCCCLYQIWTPNQYL